MSYTVILEVSKFLRQTLWNGLDGEQAIHDGNYLQGIASIKLTNPAAPDPDRRLSLWLYNILPNEHLRNASFARVANDERVQYPPLSLDLFYLVTPSTGSDEGDQYVLGKAMQIFHDSAVVQFHNPAAPGTAEELHVSLAQRSIQELAEVWEALEEPYRLSVCYEVRAVRIASQREIDALHVGERSTAFAGVGAVR
jgi:hypothetical protein